MSENRNADLGGNPYRSPSPVSDAIVAGDESGQVMTEKVLSMLRQTQPWVRFLSVLGFICSALMVLAGSIGFLAMALGPAHAGPVESVVLLAYVPMGILYFFPSFFLFRYASRINALWATRSVRQLEDALEAQKSFWKFVGILMLIMIVLYLLGLLSAVVFLGATAR
jgi:hypothetical protein